MSYTQVLLLHLNALMLVMMLRLTFTVALFHIVKILSVSETSRETFNGMSSHARVAR